MRRVRTCVPFLVGTTLIVAACSEHSTAPDIPSSVVGDSVFVPLALQGGGEGGPILQATGLGFVELELLGPSTFEITLDDRECAWPSNTVFLTQPFVDTLTTTMCQEPIGTKWAYPDTFPAGTVFRLEFTSGVTQGPGQLFLSGAFREWTVNAEDLFDTDENDFWLLCEAPSIGCDLLANPSADSILMHPVVQDSILSYWYDSRYHDQPTAVEQGGYIYRTPGGDLEVAPMGSNMNPSACQATFDGAEVGQIESTGNVVVGYFHTHPHPAGAAVPAAVLSCLGVPTPAGTVARYGSGPSPADLAAQQSTINYQGYIVDPTDVYHLESVSPPVPPNVHVTPYPRDPVCVI